MNFRTFYINNHRVRYEELKMDESVFEKCYLIENPHQDNIIAIPDGCVDLQFAWEEGVCRGYICGSFLRGKLSRISVYQRCFGIKLRPGLIFSFLKKNLTGFVENRVPLSEFIECGKLEETLSQQNAFPQMIEAASRFLYGQRLEAANNIADSTAKLIFSTPGNYRVSEMIEMLGYSQRYVNNVFKQNYGFSVKKYSDIIRVQTAIQYLETSNVMDVITGLGYYDQAHFIRDFKQYTSLTPKSFLDGVRGSKELIIV